MLSQSVRVGAPPLSVVARHVGMNARDDRYLALSGDRGRDLAYKLIVALQTGDIGADADFTAATAEWYSVLGQQQAAFLTAIQRQLIRTAPLYTPIGVGSGSFTGEFKPEGYSAALSRMVFARERLTPRTAVAYAVVTQELVTAAGQGGNQALMDAISIAVNLVLDAGMYDDISDSNAAGEVASGTTGADCLNDLRAALKSTFGPGQGTAKAFWVGTPNVAIDLTCLTIEGQPLFPDMSPSGGSLLGLPFLPAPGWGQGALSLIDGAQCIAGLDLLGMDASASADFSSALNPTENAGLGTGAEQLISAFQSNCISFRMVTRTMFATARGSATYTISGTNYAS